MSLIPQSMLGLGSPANGSGANVGFYGITDAQGLASNVTISNAFVTANSIILVSMYNANGGVVSPPVITSQTAGSFVVNNVTPQTGSRYVYYILQQ
jgi:hypothetical protein